MSSQLKERQQQESKRHIDADKLLNKHIFNTLAFTFGGYAAGMTVSLLFKRKAGIPLLMAGAGAGYGLSHMYSDMEKLKKFQGQGESHTLKRDDLIGTKDWEKYQTKEEGQHSTKGPRYGGSDDDSSDDKSGSGKTEQKKTQKESKPEPEVKRGQAKDSGKKETTSSGSHKGGEKSEKGVDSQKDQDKLGHIEGKAYSGNGKGNSKNKEHDTKSKEHDSKSKEHDNKSKEGHSKNETRLSSNHFEEGSTAKRQLNPHFVGTNPKNDAVTSGQSTGGSPNSYNDGPAKAGGSNAPGESKEGNSLLNRRGGENTKKVNEKLEGQRVSEQDRIGSSVSHTGLKIKDQAQDENVAGGKFRGKSGAGSQVNAVIE